MSDSGIRTDFRLHFSLKRNFDRRSNFDVMQSTAVNPGPKRSARRGAHDGGMIGLFALCGLKNFWSLILLSLLENLLQSFAELSF